MREILRRFETNSEKYPYIDTKFDIVSNRDFGMVDEPFRRKECIYSWIQGRGLESIAKHIGFFRKNGDLTIGLLALTVAYMLSGLGFAGYGALAGKNWQFIPSDADACCEDTAAVEAFDATFPPKEKCWMPSQEEFYIYSHSSVVR